MRNVIYLVGIMAFTFTTLGSVTGFAKPATEKGPRYYFEVRGVQIPKEAKNDLKEQAKAVLFAELKKHPSVIMDLGVPPPQGEELAKTLAQKKLNGYAIILRITKAHHSLDPAPADKSKKMLMVEVAVAIDAEKLPSGQMALAGEGMSQVGSEAKKIVEKERKELLAEALSDAIGQAINKSVSKLGSGNTRGGKGPKGNRKKN